MHTAAGTRQLWSMCFPLPQFTAAVTMIQILRRGTAMTVNSGRIGRALGNQRVEIQGESCVRIAYMYLESCLAEAGQEDSVLGGPRKSRRRF